MKETNWEGKAESYNPDGSERTYINSWAEFMRLGLEKPGRQAGNTTRMIDLIIQFLFEGNRVWVLDPWERGTNDNANKNLFDRLLRRLFREHPGIMKNHVKYDKEKFTIEFI